MPQACISRRPRQETRQSQHASSASHLGVERAPQEDLRSGPLAGAAELVVVEIAAVLLVEDLFVRLPNALHEKFPGLLATVHSAATEERQLWHSGVR